MSKWVIIERDLLRCVSVIEIHNQDTSQPPVRFNVPDFMIETIEDIKQRLKDGESLNADTPSHLDYQELST